MIGPRPPAPGGHTCGDRRPRRTRPGRAVATALAGLAGLAAPAACDWSSRTFITDFEPPHAFDATGALTSVPRVEWHADLPYPIRTWLDVVNADTADVVVRWSACAFGHRVTRLGTRTRVTFESRRPAAPDCPAVRDSAVLAPGQATTIAAQPDPQFGTPRPRRGDYAIDLVILEADAVHAIPAGRIAVR